MTEIPRFGTPVPDAPARTHKAERPLFPGAQQLVTGLVWEAPVARRELDVMIRRTVASHRKAAIHAATLRR